MLGADTRSTAGTTVADKNCEKIHYIAPNIYCCGAGTAADTESVTHMVSSSLELHRFETSRQSRVITAHTLLRSHLFRYQGYVSAALVLGGVDPTGPHLFTIYPHGSSDSLPFCTMGSGSLNAMAVFEADYKVSARTTTHPVRPTWSGSPCAWRSAMRALSRRSLGAFFAIAHQDASWRIMLSAPRSRRVQARGESQGHMRRRAGWRCVDMLRAACRRT